MQVRKIWIHEKEGMWIQPWYTWPWPVKKVMPPQKATLIFHRNPYRGVGFERVRYGDFLNKWKCSLEFSHHFYIKYLHGRSELNDPCKQNHSFTKSSLGTGSVWYLKFHQRGGMVSGPNLTQSSEPWNPHFPTPHHFRKIHVESGSSSN